MVVLGWQIMVGRLMFYGISVQVLLVRKRRFGVLRLHLKHATNMRFIGKVGGAMLCLHSPTQFFYKTLIVANV